MTTKKKKRQAKSLPKKGTAPTNLQREKDLRRQAEIDFVTDPRERSAQYWHGHPDRPYGSVVRLQRFYEWYNEDNWERKRKAWWEKNQQVLMAKITDEFAAERFKTYATLRENLGYMLEYMFPLRDPETGAVLRYDPDHAFYPNLPQMPLAMPKQHEHVASVLKVIQELALLRGEPTSRSEVSVSTGDSSESDAPSRIPRAALREMARAALEKTNEKSDE